MGSGIRTRNTSNIRTLNFEPYSFVLLVHFVVKKIWNHEWCRGCRLLVENDLILILTLDKRVEAAFLPLCFCSESDKIVASTVSK